VGNHPSCAHWRRWDVVGRHTSVDEHQLLELLELNNGVLNKAAPRLEIAFFSLV
jgi:hypothetical protein